MAISKSNTATIELLDRYFDTAFCAPEGIPKLRELILSLAMQGQLVRQNPDDKPARDLLKDIEAEKQRLIKEGKMKKSDPLPDITPDEIPYDIPDSWEWVRLGKCTHIIMGQSPDSKSYNDKGDGLPFFQGKSEYGLIYPTPKKWCNEPRKIAPYNSILISVRAPVGPTNICNMIACIGRGLSAVQGLADTQEFFLFYYFRCFEKHIASFGTGSTFSGISLKVLNNLLVPLPPLEEQRRIVEKIDSLMQKCDRFQNLQQEREAKRLQIQLAVGHKLLNAPDKQTFNEAWQFMEDNFDTLYSVKENVKELRKIILQLAVMGKLVPQDENDRSARELLKDIETEKQRLIKEGKIKKQKPLPDITIDEIPYDIPQGWHWIVLPEIVAYDHNSIKRGPFGSSLKKSFFVESGYKVYQQKNAIYDDFSLGDYYIDRDKFEELKDFEVKPKDIIISCSGTVGKLSIAPKNIEKGVINQALLKITLNEKVITNKFFVLLFSGYIMKTETLNDLKGTAQKNIVSVELLKKIPIPLPPLEEQKRIVEKVDKMMKLCDELEEKITAQTDTQTRLLHSTIAQILT